jgi:hypothetical protein
MSIKKSTGAEISHQLCHFRASILVYKMPHLIDITALDAESLCKLLSIGVILFQDLLGIDACYLDVCMAQAASKLSDRRATSHHADGEGMAQRMYLADAQVSQTDIGAIASS